MTKKNDDSSAPLQNTWTTGHAAAVTSPNQADLEVQSARVTVIEDCPEIPCTYSSENDLVPIGTRRRPEA
jgi:hypothetical protein